MITRAILKTKRGRWLHYDSPVETVVVSAGDEPRTAVPASLERLETLVEERRLPAVGFLTYEAAAAYDLATHPATELPCLCFVLFRNVRDITQEMRRSPPRGAGYAVGPWTNSVDEEEYHKRIARVRAYLAAGDTYQVNYTFRMYAPFSGDTEAFFRDMCAAQHGEYPAYLELDSGHRILSASPELFIERNGEHLFAMPMKGTAPRGPTTDEDQRNAAALRESPKERAENLMITDMIRNDLGRVSDHGSVSVPRLFEVQRFPRVLQMVSRVTAQSDASLSEVMAATFPCASITGAPKKRTMEIIRELEDTPRGVYTGSIGVLEPGRRFTLNVAIRTVVVNESGNRAVFGVGGGVVWDSSPEGEFQECATKANILAAPDPPVTLLETVRWNRAEGVFLYEGHRRRLQASARYFDIPLDGNGAEIVLEHATLHGRIQEEIDSRETPGRVRDRSGEWRVRILVNRNGLVVETAPLTDSTDAVDVAALPRRTVTLSQDPVPPETPWVRHKTTNRAIYTCRKGEHPDVDDVILKNTRGNLTESTMANLLVVRSAESSPQRYLATPPPSEGVLDGVFLRSLLDPAPGTTPWTPENLPIIVEPIPESVWDEIRRGETALYLVNSVRGWMRGIPAY